MNEKDVSVFEGKSQNLGICEGSNLQWLQEVSIIDCLSQVWGNTSSFLPTVKMCGEAQGQRAESFPGTL